MTTTFHDQGADEHTFDISDSLLPRNGDAVFRPDDLSSHLPQLHHRAADLVVVRESDESDHVLMEGCIAHTLSYCRSLPGCDRAGELGIGPLLRTEEHLEAGLAIVDLRYDKSRAVLFLIESTWFLYSEGSAARSNAHGDNPFTQILLAVIEKLRPQRMHVVALSRLVRSFEHAGLVQSAVTRHVDEVVHAGMPLVMRGEGERIGQLMWSTFASVSATERDLIVQRLVAGVVAKYRRGEWTLNRHVVPFGYKLDDKVLCVDEDAWEHVAFAWMLLAQPDCSARRIVQELGARGVASGRVRSHHGESATVADLRQPLHFVDRMVKHAPLYLTGKLTQTLASPFPDLTHLSSLPIEPPTSRYPNGYVRFDFEPGVSERVKLDPDVVRQAVDIRSSKGHVTAPTHRVAPLGMAQWETDGVAYAMYRELDNYEVRAMPAQPRDS